MCSDTVKLSKDNTDGNSNCPVSSQLHIGGFSLCTHNSRNGFCYNIFSNNNNYHNNKYKKYDDRFTSFKTWPKSHPIKVSNLAKTGFVCTGQGDRVFCPWCQLYFIL